jgi:hypothetical protein
MGYFESSKSKALNTGDNSVTYLLDMVTQSASESKQAKGPSGFIEYNGEMLVVDYGRVYSEGAPIGLLYEDGFFKDTAGVLGSNSQTSVIDDIPGCIFRGIDSDGQELVLPAGDPGPSGQLTYNGVKLNVINGRVSTEEHSYVGEFSEDGEFTLRGGAARDGGRILDDFTQLSTKFAGTRSDGSKWNHEWQRPLSRGDKTYVDNEVIRYFADYDKLQMQQKKYVHESLHIWAASGLLQIVRKSEGNCMLGNIKHGAAGVTGVRTGYVTLDKEEFEKEIVLFKRFGALAVVATKHKPYLEVRVNLVVAHEFGHQVEFVLSQATQEKIDDIYRERKKRADKLHPLPEVYEGLSELLQPPQVYNRVFISGYARSSKHEYWAECLAAFSVKDGREKLKEIDPAIHQLLCQLVTKPQELIRRVFTDTVLDLQDSLRIGGEMKDDLLNA